MWNRVTRRDLTEGVKTLTVKPSAVERWGQAGTGRQPCSLPGGPEEALGKQDSAEPAPNPEGQAL